MNGRLQKILKPAKATQNQLLQKLPKTNSGKIEFQADSFQGGTAAIWINDTKVPVNMDRRTADLTAYIQPGENTITVRVTSSLRNIMITQGYDGWIFGIPRPR